MLLWDIFRPEQENVFEAAENSILAFENIGQVTLLKPLSSSGTRAYSTSLAKSWSELNEMQHDWTSAPEQVLSESSSSFSSLSQEDVTFGLSEIVPLSPLRTQGGSSSRIVLASAASVDPASRASWPSEKSKKQPGMSKCGTNRT